MTLKPIWTEETKVKTYETDFQRRWKPVSFFRLMQEAATNHAVNLGVGYHDMLDWGMVWILSRLKIKFHHYPGIGDDVVIRTWPKGLGQKIFFMRDYKIEGTDGTTLATATSAWLLVDIHTRHFLPPQKLPVALPENDGRVALDEALEKIRQPEDMVKQFTVEPRYSSIDLLGHVNNTCYVEWISDCFAMDGYRNRVMDWMQINYNNEVKPYERIAVSLGENEGEALVSTVQGENLTSGQRAFEAVVGWVD